MLILMEILLFLIATFLIVLVLVQRGKGGGLAGALGGMGGQSAFGTKAGDLFTRITIVTASVWIVLCAFTVWYLGRGRDVITSGLRTTTSATAPAAPAGDAAKPADDTKAAPAAPAATTPAAAPAAVAPSGKPAATPEKSK